jgi:hypothetical protein
MLNAVVVRDKVILCSVVFSASDSRIHMVWRVQGERGLSICVTKLGICTIPEDAYLKFPSGTNTNCTAFYLSQQTYTNIFSEQFKHLVTSISLRIRSKELKLTTRS